MKMTKELLQELGSCGDYLRTFVRVFPTTDERYADGVEVTPEVCEANATDFSWSWAAEVMLTSEAYGTWNGRTQRGDELQAVLKVRDDAQEVYSAEVAAWLENNPHTWREPSSETTLERRAEWHAIHTRRTEASQGVDLAVKQLAARVFGELFQVDDNRSDRLHGAVESAERTRASNERLELRSARDHVVQLKREQEHWRTQPEVQLARIAEALPEAEALLTALERKKVERDAQRARSVVTTARRALEVAQQNVERAEEAAAEAARKLDEQTASTAAPATVEA